MRFKCNHDWTEYYTYTKVGWLFNRIVTVYACNKCWDTKNKVKWNLKKFKKV